MTDATIELVREIYALRDGFEPGTDQWYECCRWAELAMERDKDTFVNG